MSSTQHWKKIKLKYLADMRSGESITSDVINPIGLYPVYGGGALRGYTSEYTHEGKYVLIGRQGAHCGNVKTVQGKFWASEHAVVVTPNSIVDIEWLGYLLESMNLNQYSMSAAQPGLAVTMIKNLEVLCPTKNIQEKIAKYINTKVISIEELIEQKEKLIQLFEEKRQSMITEAVTKGLNPNVKMKDSGVEWIGEIPEHWEAKRLKNAVFLNPNKSEVNLNLNQKVTFLPMENILEPGKIDISLEKELCEVYSGYTYFRNEDIVMAKVTPCFENGNIATVDNLVNRIGFGTTELHVLRVRKGHFNKFYYYLAQSEPFKQEGVSTMYGVGGLKRIPTEFVSNYKFAVPPLEEQIEIANYLDFKCNQISNLKDVINIEIEKLKSYRQSLIYEAVTGKIDVRNFEVDAE
ncbi:TPA: restriction endonuclease subunit S [Bacillus pseudomycoides]|nr:restriction endonuclease subunit S [Bacillus pseudomycoides]